MPCRPTACFHIEQTISFINLCLSAAFLTSRYQMRATATCGPPFTAKASLGVVRSFCRRVLAEKEPRRLNVSILLYKVLLLTNTQMQNMFFPIRRPFVGFCPGTTHICITKPWQTHKHLECPDYNFSSFSSSMHGLINILAWRLCKNDTFTC